MIEETNLIDRLRQRDPAAFTQLFEAYSDRIYGLGLKLLSDEDEAEGIVQETFLRLIEKLDQFEARAKLSTWLYRVAYNICMDRLRSRRRHVPLPDEINDKQIRFGFEGVAEDGELVAVAFQRAWKDDDNPMIGIWDTVASTWRFVYYPLDAVESQNGGWVGLSEIAPLGQGRYLVLERDNQSGPDDRDPFAVSHLGWGMNPQALWYGIALHGDEPERSRAAARTFPGNFLFSTGPNTQGGFAGENADFGLGHAGSRF